MLNFRGVCSFCVLCAFFGWWIHQNLWNILPKIGWTWHEKTSPLKATPKIGETRQLLGGKAVPTIKNYLYQLSICGEPIWGFPKMVVPNNHGFSYKKWSFWGVLWGYHHLRKHPYANRKPKKNPVARMSTYVLVSLKLFDNKIPQEPILFKSWRKMKEVKKNTVSEWKWTMNSIVSPVTRRDVLLDPKTATKADKAAKTTRMTRMPMILKRITRWFQSIWKYWSNWFISPKQGKNGNTSLKKTN